MIKLQYKPDFEEALKYWDAFWKKEIIDRPCAFITAPEDGCVPKPRPAYPTIIGSDYKRMAEMYDEYISGRFWGAEAMPYCGDPSFGPDQFGSFFGAKFIQRPEENTSWVEPFIDDWEKALPLKLDTNNYYFMEMIKLVESLTQVAKGKWLVSMFDLHSNMDCLAAIRGTENLLMDLMDCPDTIDKAMRNIRSFYSPIYESIYKAGEMAERGSIGWAPFYSRGKFATVQCDFICMISPEMGKKYVIPAIEEEASYLDNSVYHYDGPGALPHLDNILAVRDLDVIQWMPGAGQPEHIGWIDLLKKIQKAGKGLEIHCSMEETKILHKELRPEGVLYCVEASSKKEANDLISWLKKNT